MLTIRRGEDRGHADHGWLRTYHTFSFANYFDRKHMNFRVLRVINEDFVAPGQGFGTHPHADMEILTYVISGELEHKDSIGNGSIIRAGEFQRMSAGTGVTHSEFNPSGTNPTHLYQIWIIPEKKGLTPGYEQKSFNEPDKLRLVVSRDGREGTLKMNQDILIYCGRYSAGGEDRLPLNASRYGWLQVLNGKVRLSEEDLLPGDGVALEGENNPGLTNIEDSTVFFFDLP